MNSYKGEELTDREVNTKYTAGRYKKMTKELREAKELMASKREQRETQMNKPVITNPNVTCAFCGKAFKYPGDRAAHLKRAHQNSKRFAWWGNRKGVYQCRICRTKETTWKDCRTLKKHYCDTTKHSTVELLEEGIEVWLLKKR